MISFGSNNRKIKYLHYFLKFSTNIHKRKKEKDNKKGHINVITSIMHSMYKYHYILQICYNCTCKLKCELIRSQSNYLFLYVYKQSRCDYAIYINREIGIPYWQIMAAHDYISQLQSNCKY